MSDVPGNLHSVRSPCELRVESKFDAIGCIVNAVQRLGASHGRTIMQRALSRPGMRWTNQSAGCFERMNLMQISPLSVCI